MLDLVGDKFNRLPERYQRRAREIALRVKEIDAACAPCQPSDVQDAVIRMAMQFRDQPDTDQEVLAREYVQSCRDIPAWAVSEAASDFLSGRVENHTGQFMPTCAEFAKRARHVVTPFLSERASLKSEASMLFDRAEDEQRRHIIAMQRQDPAVQKRVQEVMERARIGAPEKVVYRQSGISGETAAKLDAYRRPREFVSKIEETPIVRASRKAAE